MKWDKSFSVGIDSIDKQHKKIFGYLLSLENSVNKRDPWHIIRFLVEDLSNYMKFHIAVEEALLEVIAYPDRDSHAESHEVLMEQIAELTAKLEKSPSDDKLLQFFENWFVRHVLKADLDYVAYIRKHFPALAASRQ